MGSGREGMEACWPGEGCMGSSGSMFRGMVGLLWAGKTGIAATCGGVVRVRVVRASRSAVLLLSA